MGFQKHLVDHGGSLCKSEMKKVLTVEIQRHWDSLMVINMAEELAIGVPVQIQFEIIPKAPIGPFCSGACSAYLYSADIKSIKARVKPDTAQFVGDEEKSLDLIIDDTAEENERIAECIKKHAKKVDEANRFTGLEI